MDRPVIRRPHPLFCGHTQSIYKFKNRRGASVLEGGMYGKKVSICPVIYLSDDPEDFTLESKEYLVEKELISNTLEVISKQPEVAWPVMHRERKI